MLPRRDRAGQRHAARHARRDRPIDVLTHPALARLHPTGAHPECEARLAVLLRYFTEWIEGRPATNDELLLCHTAEHIERIRALQEPTLFDADTIGSASTFEAASLAAGTTIEAAMRGGFALVRPPGHHALRDRAMGFCFFNNIAVAARVVQRELGLARIAIVDYDVHHGNGTDAIFRDDDSVLFVSLHEWPFYPGTGGPDDQAPTTLNIPLHPGCGDDEYLDAFERLVEPAVAAFEPELVLVSAGFDAHVDDPLASM
ncbi:MAG TPA: histone deacetylase, partial [Gaiellaceae bacterium]